MALLKRFSLLIIIFICLIPEAGAQAPYKIMDWKVETTLRSYLLQTVHQQYDVRREALATAMRTPEGIIDYRNHCRQKYLQLLGQMPEKTPLNTTVTGRIQRTGYSVEKIIYESRPGHHVTSNLYLPHGKGPFPGILIFCGHEMTSKATESYQETAILLALNGFAAFVIDPISQGERVQFTDPAGKRILRGSTTEHTLLNAGASLTGTSIVAWELFDNVRSLDYLVSRPEVDSSRIGCMGNSGGGAQTTWFVAYDERIKAAAPCSFITSREREYELNGTGDGCQQIPSEGRELLEIADYLIMFAPKPLLILAGRYDFVDYTGTVDAYRELADVYTRLGEADKIKLFTGEDGHGISELKRESAAKWFRKWFYADTSDITRDIIIPVPEIETYCTSTGQVTSFFSDEVTVQSVNLKNALNLCETRSKFMNQNSREAIQAKLRGLLAVNSPDNKINTELTASEGYPGYELQKMIIRKEGEVPLPCLVFLPQSNAIRDSVILYLDHRGKASVLKDSAFAGTQTGKGHVILLADLRGMGETAEKPQANDPKYYNAEYHNAVLSLHTGQPLPGQRVKDIFSLLDYLDSSSDLCRLPVRIIASGPAAVPALFAAVLDDRITALDLSETVKSYVEITERPMERDWYSYVVPGILNYFDLADLVTLRPDLKVRFVNQKSDGNGK